MPIGCGNTDIMEMFSWDVEGAGFPTEGIPGRRAGEKMVFLKIILCGAFYRTTTYILN